MQEIEFQSSRNPWTLQEVSHSFENYSCMEFAGSDPAWNGNVKLFLQSTPLPFICFYHLGKETTANLPGKKIRKKLSKLVLFQHQ